MINGLQYKMTRDELTRQIHQTLREIYPHSDFSAGQIFKMIDESSEKNNVLIFKAAEFAEINEIDKTEFMTGLYIELGVEFEKNLHDKFYFTMTKDETTLTFKMIENSQ